MHPCDAIQPASDVMIRVDSGFVVVDTFSLPPASATFQWEEGSSRQAEVWIMQSLETFSWNTRLEIIILQTALHNQVGPPLMMLQKLAR